MSFYKLNIPFAVNFLVFLILFITCNDKHHTGQKEGFSASISEKKFSFSKADTLVRLANINREFNLRELVKTSNLDTGKCSLNLKAGTDYQKTKNGILALRTSLKEQYLQLKDSAQKDEFLDSVSQIFSDYLLNKIIPYWYGTTWAYEGFTDVPNDGEIACGYFISTTLKHTGLNLNRYKFAQGSGTSGAKTLSFNNPENKFVYRNEETDYSSMLNAIEDGLYTVGLDCHVGYLYKKDHNSFFIHSNYIEGKVMIENAELSDAFLSHIHLFTKITSNKELMRHWLLNKKIEIIR